MAMVTKEIERSVLAYSEEELKVKNGIYEPGLGLETKTDDIARYGMFKSIGMDQSYANFSRCMVVTPKLGSGQDIADTLNAMITELKKDEELLERAQEMIDYLGSLIKQSEPSTFGKAEALDYVLKRISFSVITKEGEDVVYRTRRMFCSDYETTRVPIKDIPQEDVKFDGIEETVNYGNTIIRVVEDHDLQEFGIIFSKASEKMLDAVENVLGTAATK